MGRAYANVLKGEMTRKKILKLLAENYALSVAFISHSLLLSYTATMKHLKILKEQDLIVMWKGKKGYTESAESIFRTIERDHKQKFIQTVV